ncbi:ATP-binding protein [Actinacidiphila rubida]|uniref:Anti-sigma regulatory factor (Ser/Thr protein kinase) n=1 Tax=Actinacidiphila rubida TaxID=310780 RepID=A0A1H8N9C9_9ACTN|nr:ATP-binding protein [Actinacidiphila rubida]SEO26162.1 Anti-sigma regulatory factor (Ser/Thr protein kinase) [Actinacidiphila rubida]
MHVPECADASAVDLLFPRRPRRVAAARNATRKALAEWGVPPEAAEAAVLVVSELVTNAVRHAEVPSGREVGLRVTRPGPDRIRVEVDDADTTVPRLRVPSDDDESSRGLPLIVALSIRHGVCPRLHGIGKTVWAEITTGLPECSGQDT